MSIYWDCVVTIFAPVTRGQALSDRNIENRNPTKFRRAYNRSKRAIFLAIFDWIAVLWCKLSRRRQRNVSGFKYFSEEPTLVSSEDRDDVYTFRPFAFKVGRFRPLLKRQKK